MPINDFITTVLNLDPDDIELLDVVNHQGKLLEIFLTLKSKHPCCIYCGGPTVSKELKKEKVILPDISSIPAIIRWSRRRFKSKDCQRTFLEENRFSPAGFNSSYSTLRSIMIALRNPHLTIRDIAVKYHVSSPQVIKYLDSFLVVPRLSLPVNPGIDEIHSGMSAEDSSYLCVFVDNDNSQLIELLSSRSKRSLSRYLDKIPLNEREKVLFVTIDMWEPYRDIALKYFPNCVVAVDPFHVVEHLYRGFTRLRIEIMNQMERSSAGYYLLKTWHKLLESDKYDFSPDKERVYNRFFGAKLNYYDLREMMLNLSPVLKQAFLLKNRYRNFNKNSSYENAGHELNILINSFVAADLHCYSEFIQTVIHWKVQIINSFRRPSSRKLSNAIAENINGQIRTMISVSNGFDNFYRFRARAIYCFNKSITYHLSNKLSSLAITKGQHHS